jgi:uncharacterized protein YggE
MCLQHRDVFPAVLSSLMQTRAAACTLCCTSHTGSVSFQAYLEMVDEAVEADAQKTRQVEAKVAAEVEKVLKMLELHNGVSRRQVRCTLEGL